MAVVYEATRLGDGERIAVNVAVLYKEFAGDTSPNDVTALFGLMAQIHKEIRKDSRG